MLWIKYVKIYRYFLGAPTLRRLYTMYAPASMTWKAITTNINMPILGAAVEITKHG
jgi:hypothetical protein